MGILKKARRESLPTAHRVDFVVWGCYDPHYTESSKGCWCRITLRVSWVESVGKYPDQLGGVDRRGRSSGYARNLAAVNSTFLHFQYTFDRSLAWKGRRPPGGEFALN